MNGSLGIGGLIGKVSAADKVKKNLSDAEEKVKSMTRMLEYTVKVCGREGAEKLLDELGNLMLEYAKETEGKSPDEIRKMDKTYEKRAAAIIGKYVPGPSVKEFSRPFRSGAKVWARLGAIAGGVGSGIVIGGTAAAGASAASYAALGIAAGAGAGAAIGVGVVALTFGSPYLAGKAKEKFREKKIRELAWKPGEVVPKKEE
jgi:hypothetical protein